MMYTSNSLRKHEENEDLFSEFLLDQRHIDQIGHRNYQSESEMNYHLAILMENEEQGFLDSVEQSSLQKDSVKSLTQNGSQMYLRQMDEHSSQVQPQIKKLQRNHLKRKRNRGNQHELQKNVKGYWTKNFLQFGKKSHFKFIKDKIFTLSKQEKKVITAVKRKNGISLSDYENMYGIQGLQACWQEFFQGKQLYRDLMLSRVKGKFRLIYVKFMHVYEEAFRTKKFTGISIKQQKQHESI